MGRISRPHVPQKFKDWGQTFQSKILRQNPRILELTKEQRKLRAESERDSTTGGRLAEIAQRQEDINTEIASLKPSKGPKGSTRSLSDRMHLPLLREEIADIILRVTHPRSYELAANRRQLGKTIKAIKAIKGKGPETDKSIEIVKDLFKNDRLNDSYKHDKKIERVGREEREYFQDHKDQKALETVFDKYLDTEFVNKDGGKATGKDYLEAIHEIADGWVEA
jgi:hypothetical protein